MKFNIFSLILSFICFFFALAKNPNWCEKMQCKCLRNNIMDNRKMFFDCKCPADIAKKVQEDGFYYSQIRNQRVYVSC